MHWADSEAERIIEERGGEHVVACGISPSGPIHYGNFREVATAHLIHEALLDAGAESRLIWISDDYDPLRKVYPFLPEEYEEHVGKPLSEIPDPEGCHDSYSEHFEEPFLESLQPLGIEPEVRRASEMYRNGLYDDAILEARDRRDEIAEIIEEVTGRDLPEGWIPFNPLCDDCGAFAEASDDTYTCPQCGKEGEVDPSHGKLPWRVDWPARWEILGVTVEPFGKDHAASGGSYDTGTKIAGQVFDYTPPHPVVYEQIGLKGEGEMSSSKGVTVTPGELLSVMEPELMTFVIASTKPKKHIDLDLGAGLPRLYDRMDGAEKKWRNGEEASDARAFELSTTENTEEIDLPFSHAVNAVQIDPENPTEPLKRSSYSTEAKRVNRRLGRAANWVESYAPESYLFTVKEEAPDVALSDEQEEILREVAEVVASGAEADGIQNAIYETSQELDMGAGDAFGAVYLALLDQENGPRAGPFIAALDREFVAERFRELSAE